MAIRKFLPLGQLPRFTLAGGDRDWEGTPPKWADAADLPLAWLYPGLAAIDPAVVIHYRGTQCNDQNMPVRRPNVLMCSEEQAELFLADPVFKAGVDRLGIILCSLIANPSTEDMAKNRTMLQGLPTRPNGADPDFRTPAPVSQYLGGRLLVMQVGAVSDYYTSHTDADDAYDAEAAGVAFCSSHGYGAGTSSMPTSLGAHGLSGFISVELVVDETHTAVITDDIAFLIAASERFDRLKISVLLGEFEEDTQDYPAAVTCFDTVAGANTLVFPGDGRTVEGTNQPSVDQLNAKNAEILDLFVNGTSGIVVNGEGITFAEYLAFFEED